MSQLIEFIGNNTLIVVTWGLVLGMLVFSEYQRLFSGALQISVPEAIRLQNDDSAVFLDVREANEFKKGHIIDAHSHPLSSFDKNISQMDKHKSNAIIVYCATGARSNRACAKLRKKEYATVYNLAGGVSAWEKANLPLVTK